MEEIKIKNFIKSVLGNMPLSWLGKTTHRLDIYNEDLAKTEFLDQFEDLFNKNDFSASALNALPTAFDYIRLGHPLSCVLEWAVAKLNGRQNEKLNAKLNNVNSKKVISFASTTMPILAVLRSNLLKEKNTQIIYKNKLPDFFNEEILKNIYGYKFDLVKIDNFEDIPTFAGSTICISSEESFGEFNLASGIDFFLSYNSTFGSLVVVNGKHNETYVSDIQHVRRRETIAMTPSSCHSVLNYLITGESFIKNEEIDIKNKNLVLNSIKEVTNTETEALLGSCGLSIQYAIVMGLVHDSLKKNPGKKIKIIVPTNCYGGTNDQARRLAAGISGVEVLDLHVDGGKDMVQSIEGVLEKIALEDVVPCIIAEIPTNPRVEVPDLINLVGALSKKRKTADGSTAIEPVFILDQTFCPNIEFLKEGGIFSTVKTISYVSGSKFPSGGLCTAGYCVANKKAEDLLKKIKRHLKLCDNEAKGVQLEILAKQMPSMKKRINDSYKNTREFVSFIIKTLPEAKINFVSEELAIEGFTPSVFSLDLPTKGDSDKEREAYKRDLNHRLINLMIAKIPNESQHCVSYGQLSGCYWTIPATSTQGTTKEKDKDYIVRVAVSPDMDVELHKNVFLEFVKSI